MKINQPIHAPTTKANTSSPASGPTSGSDNPITTNAQLVELKQQLGEVVRAKILAIEPRPVGPAVTASSAPQANNPAGDRPHADLTGYAGKAADLHRRNLLNQEALQQYKSGTDFTQPAPGQNALLQKTASSTNTSSQLWQISLQLAGLNKPVITEFQTRQLPDHWVKGNSLLLSIDPGAGLKVLLDSAAPMSPSVRPLLQSLARFLPLQSDLRSGLHTLLVAAQAESATKVSATGNKLSSGYAGRPPAVSPAAPAKSSTETAGSAKHSEIRQLLATLLNSSKTSSSPFAANGKPGSAAGFTTSVGGPVSPPADYANKPSINAAGVSNFKNSPSLTVLSPLVKDLLTVMSKALLSPAQSQDPAQLKAGLKQSGTSMEAALLAGERPSGGLSYGNNNPSLAMPVSAKPVPTTPASTAADGNQNSQLTNDIKSWLATLRHMGRLSDPGTALRSPLLQEAPADLKALLLTTLGAMMSHLQQSPQSQQLPTNWENLLSWLMPRTANFHPTTHPLQFPGQITQAARQALTTEGLDAGEILRALVQTIARIQVNQFNMLQQNTGPSGELPPNQVWFAELPILGKQLDTVQLRFEKQSRQQNKTQRQRQWKLVLAFDFAALGPLQSHVIYTDGTVSATFWADQRQTLRLLNDEVPRLRNGLQNWGVTVGEIKVRKGHPPPPQNPVSHQLLDERA